MEDEVAYVSMKDLLEAGVHFGHQTRRWNPKMKPYIFGARGGIYVIDLQKTVVLFRKAYDFIVDTVASGREVLFVATKKQAAETIEEQSKRCKMFFVNHRWLGGTLTNYTTISRSIERLKKLEQMSEDGSIHRFPKKEVVSLQREMLKLERNLGGIKDMKGIPGAVFVVDPKKEHIAVHEARKIGVPVVAIVDTNCDPEQVDYVVPGNDDAKRSIRLLTSAVADAVLEGMARREERRRAVAEEQPSDEPSFEELSAGVAAEAAAADEAGPEVFVKPRRAESKVEAAADSGEAEDTEAKPSE